MDLVRIVKEMWFLDIFLAAILASIFGIMVSYYWKGRNLKILKKNITIELIDIYNKIKIQLNNECSPIDYPTDAWDTAKSSEIFPNLVKDVKYYSSIKYIYQKIDSLAILETTYESNNPNSINLIKNKRSELSELIAANFSQLKIKGGAKYGK